MRDDIGPTLDPIEALRIVPLAEAVRLSGVSEDTLRRKHSHKFVRLSERRVGMRLRDALMLPPNAESAAHATP
jgi:hypothetical protein